MQDDICTMFFFVLKPEFLVGKIKNKYEIFPPGNLMSKRIQEANDGIDMDSDL